MNLSPNVNTIQITSVLELKILKSVCIILNDPFLGAVFVHFHIPACRHCFSFACEM